MRIALKFAYDGRRFAGYARQPREKTVEGELLHAFLRRGFIRDPQTSCFRSASRTDKGVSALGNVAAVTTDSPKEEIIHALYEESSDFFVYGTQYVPLDFYPRYAKQRVYRYYLKDNGFILDDIISAAAVFTGSHNFRNFARVEEGKNPNRTIDVIIVSEEKGFFILDFYAQTFLWNQIRRIVSAITKVGCEKLMLTHLTDALDNPDNKKDFGLAPAEPLLLKDVIYDFAFDYERTAQRKLKKLERDIVTSLLIK